MDHLKWTMGLGSPHTVVRVYHKINDLLQCYSKPLVINPRGGSMSRTKSFNFIQITANHAKKVRALWLQRLNVGNGIIFLLPSFSTILLFTILLSLYPSRFEAFINLNSSHSSFYDIRAACSLSNITRVYSHFVLPFSFPESIDKTAILFVIILGIHFDFIMRER